MSDDRDFITVLYDDALIRAGQSMTLREIREALVPDIVDMLKKRERDLEAEALSLINEHLNPIRRTRSTGLRRDLEYVLDYWVNPDEAANIEPLLSRGYKLGTQEGDDKTLRFWSVDDLRRSAMARYREAAEVMRAAREFDETVHKVVERMGEDGRTRLGDPRGGLGSAA